MDRAVWKRCSPVRVRFLVFGVRRRDVRNQAALMRYFRFFCVFCFFFWRLPRSVLNRYCTILRRCWTVFGTRRTALDSQRTGGTGGRRVQGGSSPDRSTFFKTAQHLFKTAQHPLKTVWFRRASLLRTLNKTKCSRICEQWFEAILYPSQLDRLFKTCVRQCKKV